MIETPVTRRQSLVNLAVIGAAAAAGGALLQTETAEAAQPRMVTALADLQTARHQLALAIPDKGGHRVKALALIDRAINEVKAGIAAGR